MAITINGNNVNIVIFNGSPVAHLFFNGVEVPFGARPTELDYTLTAGTLTQTIAFTQSAANAVTVDWGDGTTPVTSANLSASLSHTYAAAGNYTVTISVEDGETCTFVGPGGGSALFPPQLTAVRGGKGLVLGVLALSNCAGLVSVTMPSDGADVGGGAFQLCANLVSVTMPDGQTAIGNSMFYGCSSLTSVELPDTLTAIDDSAFQGCSGLTTLALSAGVTTIGAGAFNGCSGLTSLTLPAGMTTIGARCFASCSGMTSLTCLATVPPSASSNTFSGLPSGCPIYVPAGSVSAYQAATGWSARAADIRAIPA